MSEKWPEQTQINNQQNDAERKSGIVKIINAGKKEKDIADYFENLFKDQREYKFEVKKTKEEIETIKLVNEKIAGFVKQYGGNPVSINSDHIHIFDKKKIPKEVRKRYYKSGGFFSPRLQGAVIFSDLRENKELFKKTLVHEMLHFNSFQSIISRNGRLERNRVGANIYSSKNNKVFFYDLDESIIDELTRRFCLNFFGLEIKNESDELEEELKKSLDNIYEKNAHKYKNKEEIFFMLAKMVLTGKLMDVARLIEKSFGKGSFREAAEITAKKIE